MYFSIKLADRKITIKKENISSSLIYDTVNLSKMAGKAEHKYELYSMYMWSNI